ncbi:uncharacterized protein LOC123224172 isoform X2 [Mangifera indica]|uniref:uncharacterized protein LOC123224172 isoform X2 n=1 Tax=Mangifera indica TaxID=29780 RepID=UPI001CFBC980|nr:uncharacterized protein LOC123224172 isoform X2 [Mangifera indica]
MIPAMVPFQSVKMSRIQSRKTQKINVDKQFAGAGCLGRMVNLFDLGTGVPGNRLLTDKQHHEGVSLSRSRSDVARMSPSADQIEDKLVVSEFRRTSSNKKANGTPMKTLIAQEMSKEVEFKHNQPNLVAKLMGLDALPHQPSSAAQKSHSKSYSRHSPSHSAVPLECWEQDHGFLDDRMPSKVHQFHEQSDCKHVHEIWQQSQQASYSRDSSLQKGRYDETTSEKKMALVRQTFMEAKRLATDEKLRQSKEFQDALEVLSSNQDLFLRFLQEPNSLFSQHLYDLQAIAPPPETKKITVLRPSKMVDDEKFIGSRKLIDKQSSKPAQVVQATGQESNNPGYSPVFANHKVNEHPTQSTRIVVLKPSPGKTHDIKAVVSPTSLSSRISHNEDFYEEPEDGEVQESGDVGKEITKKIREYLMGHRRDETVLSSVFSNGYVGDESSFNQPENEYAAAHIIDSETISPTSRHSWDYINRFGSPYSSSSFSCESCSPESSVCREAKKRLSERWAMMASNGNFEEQRHVRRSSSTLGDMLALSDTKKSVRYKEEVIKNEQEPRVPTLCLTSDLNTEESECEPLKNLMRSKSVPVSSTVYGAGLNVEVADPGAGQKQVPKQLTKTKSAKSSLKEKVSSLFFSKSKKSTKEKYSASQSEEEFQSVTAEAPGSAGHIPVMVSSDTSQCVNTNGLGDCSSPGLYPSNKTSSPDLTDMSCIFSREAGLSVSKPLMPGTVNENQDQPSPISVLEPPFEEDDNTFPESSSNIKPEHRGTVVSCKPHLIDKSPPIESIARTLSWDESCAETATAYALKASSLSGAEEVQDWLFFVQTLLSASGLDGELQSETFFVRWHSPESPLDPSLREKYASLNEKEPVHEAKRRQRRSNRKLVFDCVNTALVEITGYGSESDRSSRAVLCSRAHNTLAENRSPMVVDHVLGRMKEWYISEVGDVFSESGNINSLVVEGVVRKEVLGKGWGEQMRIELDNLGKEIELNLWEVLVDEAVVDLTGGVL